MPQEPKKRHSRARQGKRRAHIKLTTSQGKVCLQCKTIIPSHTICPSCGYYKQQLVKILNRKEKTANEKSA